MFWQILFYAGGIGFFLLVTMLIKKEDVEIED